VAYAIDNAIFQWEDGERRLRDRGELEGATFKVVEELRRRLGSSFSLAELADLYGEGTDWASEVVDDTSAGTDVPAVVDAAFARYAREAHDYSGGSGARGR
jgi:hypothetical protein